MNEINLLNSFTALLYLLLFFSIVSVQQPMVIPYNLYALVMPHPWRKKSIDSFTRTHFRQTHQTQSDSVVLTVISCIITITIWFFQCNITRATIFTIVGTLPLTDHIDHFISIFFWSLHYDNISLIYDFKNKTKMAYLLPSKCRRTRTLKLWTPP